MGDFIVMPNHVHLLAAFAAADAMKVQCDSWLHYTAFQINKATGKMGKFWQQEPFDHLVRSLEQYEYLRQYIADNPHKAGLSLSSTCIGDTTDSDLCRLSLRESGADFRGAKGDRSLPTCAERKATEAATFAERKATEAPHFRGAKGDTFSREHTHHHDNQCENRPRHWPSTEGPRRSPRCAERSGRRSVSMSSCRLPSDSDSLQRRCGGSARRSRKKTLGRGPRSRGSQPRNRRPPRGVPLRRAPVRSSG